MTFSGTSVIFLEDSDFKNNILQYKGRPAKGKWLVMVQGTYCGFCVKAKPAFVNLSKRHSNVIFATIQVDGSDSEKALAKRLPEITKKSISGIPTYLLFEEGKFSALISGGQKENELIEFMK